MKAKVFSVVTSASVLTVGLTSVTAMAQQITGTPGSPGATTTIDGKQLPPPDPKFGGDIKEKASESKAWWPPRIVPPKGAPNVLLIMTDDSSVARRALVVGLRTYRRFHPGSPRGWHRFDSIGHRLLAGRHGALGHVDLQRARHAVSPVPWHPRRMGRVAVVASSGGTRSPDGAAGTRVVRPAKGASHEVSGRAGSMIGNVGQPPGRSACPERIAG